MLEALLVTNSHRLETELTPILGKNFSLQRAESLGEAPLSCGDPGLSVIICDLVNCGNLREGLLAALRNRPAENRVPVIVLVPGSTSSSDAADILEAGASDCVPFPVDFRELLARIRIHSGHTVPESLREEVRVLREERDALRAQCDRALRDRESLEAIINTVVMHDSLVEDQMNGELEAAKYEACHDPLTQLYNRLSFDALLACELARARETNEVFSLIMLDIDHFKLINDTWGHEKGDEVLVTLAGCIKKLLPPRCVLCRWGGEEFMIMPSGFSASQAQDLAEYLRGSIEKYSFGAPGKVTCSFGVTEYRQGEHIQTLIARVDEGMYEAKNAGRNRVRVR